MPVQIICNFHKDPNKTKQDILRTSSNTSFFGTKGQGTPESMIQSCPRFYACPGYLQVSVKTKLAMLRTSSNLAFFGTKEQVHVTPKSIIGTLKNGSEV